MRFWWFTVLVGTIVGAVLLAAVISEEFGLQGSTVVGVALAFRYSPIAGRGQLKAGVRPNSRKRDIRIPPTLH